MNIKRAVSFLTLIILMATGALSRAGTDPLKKVAEDLTQQISNRGRLRTAVLQFPHHDRRLSQGPFLVSERLTTFLAMENNLILVERARIEDLLSEIHFSQSGMVDSKTAQEIGRILGAQVIITGTLINLRGGMTEVNARGILAENGRIIAASQAQVEREWQGNPRLNFRHKRKKIK